MEFFTRPWTEIASIAAKSIASNDVENLEAVDATLHHLLLHQIDRGDPESREQFVLDLMDIVRSKESAAIPPAEPVRRYLTRWEHIAELSDMLRRDVTALDSARELLRSREHGDKLLRKVTAAGPGGIKSGELAGALGISQAYLAKLLREFEEHDIIERRRAGKFVYISRGLIGQMLSEKRPAIVWDRKQDFQEDAAAREPLDTRLFSRTA